MPEVTVFVLSVGSPRTLEGALDSVASQTVRDVEVFVLERPDPGACVQVRAPRPGVGVLVPRGSQPWTDAGSGRYLAFLRSDDRWLPRALERALSAAASAPGTAVGDSEISTLLVPRSVVSELGGIAEWPDGREAGRAIVNLVRSRCPVTRIATTVTSLDAPSAPRRDTIDLVHDTVYWRTRRRLAATAHAMDDAVTRAWRGGAKRVLFEAASPLSLAVFQPVLDRLRQDRLVDVWFTSADRSWSSRQIFDPAGLRQRVVAPSIARLMKFDGYINTDFWNTTWLPRRPLRFHMFHGVAGKYRLDAPVQIAPVVSTFDRLLFPNFDRLRRYEDAGLVARGTRQAALIGYPKVDCLVDGSLERTAIALKLALDPARKTVVYAPTWSPYSSLQAHGLDAIRSLVASGFNVIVKLHDRSYERAPRGSGGIDWAAAIRKIARAHPVHIAEGADASPFLCAADALVTDHSSIGFEYMLLDRPIVVIDCPLLIEKARVSEDKVRLLRDAAAIVSTGAAVGPAAARELDEPGRRSAERRRTAAELFYRAGGATDRAVRCLYDAIEIEAPVTRGHTAAVDRIVLDGPYPAAPLSPARVSGASNEAVSAFRS